MAELQHHLPVVAEWRYLAPLGSAVDLPFDPAHIGIGLAGEDHVPPRIEAQLDWFWRDSL